MRRLKRSVVLVLILLSLLLSTILGIVLGDDKNATSSPEAREKNIPKTFLGAMNNHADLPQEIIEVITKYMDDYYLSLYTLQKQDTGKYFIDEITAAISDRAIQLIVDSRKLYDYDFTLSGAHYDLQIVDVNEDGDKYDVYFLEDDHMNFSFLDGISSQCLAIENRMTLQKVNGEYKILDYDKIQGYYSIFYENHPESTKQCDDLYDYYYKQVLKYKENDDYLKTQVEGKDYVAGKTCNIAYDRRAAVDYADKYYHIRNSDWYDFTQEGGNCQNYASQCIYNGSMPMDYSGEYQWKCYIEDSDYDPGLNEDDEKYGRSASWVHVSSFEQYCENNGDSGLVCDSDVNIHYAQEGDIIQVGIGSVSHTTIVSKVIDGHILLNSNSIDMKDWPLDANIYPIKKLIKILGSNE